MTTTRKGRSDGSRCLANPDDFKGWSAPSPVATQDLPYSIIEPYVASSGAGKGTMSRAAEVQLDEQSGTLSLTTGSTNLLTDVKRKRAKP